MRKYLLIALIPLIPFTAQAGAWTQPEGETQVIATALYYRADSYFNANGTVTPQPAYSKLEANPYIEYGLLDGLTVGANLFLDHLDDSTHTNTGLGDSEWFARQRLYDDGKYVFSVQPEIKLPSPEAYSSRTPIVGSQHVDFGLRALGGMNGTLPLLGYSYYTEAEAAYRHRTGGPNDQALLASTTGVSITDTFTAMAQVFQTVNLGSLAGAAFTQSPGDDYDLTTVQLSGLYQFSPDKAVQLGVFDNVAGLNTGRGMGVLVALWKTF